MDVTKKGDFYCLDIRTVRLYAGKILCEKVVNYIMQFCSSSKWTTIILFQAELKRHSNVDVDLFAPFF